MCMCFRFLLIFFILIDIYLYFSYSLLRLSIGFIYGVSVLGVDNIIIIEVGDRFLIVYNDIKSRSSCFNDYKLN
jgi:hypothetical protein